jgi:hypothetical protein
MKKPVILLIAIVFVIIGCKSKKTTEYTVLGLYTPYQNAGTPEKLIGKVEKMTERCYWAIPDGDTFKKGNPITDIERDSIGWPPNWECTFDKSGDPVICSWLYANNKSIRRYEMFKENNILTLAKLYYNDTLGKYEKIRHNADGDIIEQKVFNAVVDTLLFTYISQYSLKRDTLIRQFYDYKGIPSSKRIAIVDKDGKYLSFTYYKEDGTPVRGQEFKYNEKGNNLGLIKWEDNKENVTEHWYLSPVEYDQKGNVIMSIVKNKKGMVSIWERTYTYFE